MSNPLFRVRENWDYWWKVELAAEQQQEIEQFVASMSDVAQESFIQWVKDWTRQRFQRAGAGRLVLMQLAHMLLFQSWKCLEPYHLKNLKGVNAIILQGEDGGQPDDIKPLIVMLIPKEKKDDPCWVRLNLKVRDAPLENVRNAALSLLSGVGLVLLLGGWGLVGRKPRRWWRLILLDVWVALAFGILCFLLIATQPTDDILVPALWMLLAVTFVEVLCAIFSSFREVLHARKWKGLLQQSQLCMLLGGVEDGRLLKVEGPSFGVALCLGILLALYEEDPGTAGQSWLWGQFFA